MKKPAILACMTAFLLFLASCASTPPQQPVVAETPPAPAAQPAETAAPDAELAQARTLKDRIDAEGLAQYAADDYQTASADLQAGESEYGTDNAAAKSSLDKAITGFNAVITKGAPLRVASIQEKTEASKKAADDLLAAVAVKDRYAQANDVYTRGLKEKDAGDLENAAKDFTDAQGFFDAAAEAAQEKKDVALRALDDIQVDMGRSEQMAADAQQGLTDEGIPAQAGGQ